MNKIHYLFHGVCYYVAWTACILLAAHGFPWLSTSIIIAITLVQICWLHWIQKKTHGLFILIILLTVTGTLIDTTLVKFGYIIFVANSFSPYLSPPWMISIWISFAVLLFASLQSLFNHPMILSGLSLLGFPIAYAAGVKMGAAIFPYGYQTSILIGVIWMILLPMSIQMYKRILTTR